MKKKVLVVSAIAVTLFGAATLKSAPSANLGWRAIKANGGGDGAATAVAYVGGESGAALGTLVCPGIGTLIGGAIGAY